MLKRYDIINEIIKKYGYKDYLEIGCDLNKTWDNVKIKNKTGADPKRGGNLRMTSDEFFEKNKKKFDIIFIDGLHHAGQVAKDINNSLACLSDNGTIVVHDCNPTEEIHQRVPRETKVWNGDVWKAWVYLRRKRNNLYMFVVNTDYGVGIIRRGIKTDIISNKKLKLTYRNFNVHKKNWLRLVSEEWFMKWLKAPVVCFYPQMPHHNKVIDICKDNCIEYHNNINLYHDLLWHFDRGADQILGVNTKSKGINCDFINARKDYLQEKHKIAFGYNTLVSPDGKGEAVEKSNEQAAHDGHIVSLPIVPKPNHIYERVINNKVEGSEYRLDIRVFIMKREIPCIVEKYVLNQERFSGTAVDAKIVDAEKLLSKEEIGKILKLAELLNLDYGELDCLRDADGTLYVVDVNPTPGNIVYLKLPEDGSELKSMLVKSFAKNFIQQ